MSVSTIAIMQPYFLPYAGYFRLFSASDLFVIYDCVQFPRRGWVHRNQFVDRSGVERWLTLPLEKSRQNTLIRDLRFVPNANEVLSERLKSLPLAASEPAGAAPFWRRCKMLAALPSIILCGSWSLPWDISAYAGRWCAQAP